MKFLLINILVLTTYCFVSCSSKLTAEEFTFKYIQNTLNTTESNQNFVIAPYEAYNLYQEIFQLNESNESNDDEKEEEAKNSYEILPDSTVIIKERKILTPSHKNNNNTEMNLKNLLSTITLKARWSFNFQSRDTHRDAFYQLGSRDHKLNRDFLRKDDIFQYYHDDQLNVSVLELPLNLNKIKFSVILPDDWEALAQLKEYMTDNLELFLNSVLKNNLRSTLCRVSLPKFHLSYKRDLKDFYEELSTKDIETYKNVHQFSNLEFNERGIGKFEKTTVLFWNVYSHLRVTPQFFDINHPFFFLVTNEEGIQFFGQVVKMNH